MWECFPVQRDQFSLVLSTGTSLLSHNVLKTITQAFFDSHQMKCISSLTTNLEGQLSYSAPEIDKCYVIGQVRC